jgi:alpha-acetolactate decarboxylase
MKKLINLILSFTLVSCASRSYQVEQYGTMHEAIGNGQSQARIKLDQLTQQKDFVGIGALEGLEGEVTILNAKAVTTVVNSKGEPTPTSQANAATMFVGGNVKEWKMVKTPKKFTRKELESWLTSQITASPAMFKVKGELINVRMHVLNGACPVHARMNKITLSKNKKPYEGEFKEVTGTIIGVYARDAVGKLTHPDTSIHTHILYKDSRGNELTGHLEDFQLDKNTKVFLPKI